MAELKLGGYTDRGKPCFVLPEGSYYLVSKHRTNQQAREVFVRLFSRCGSLEEKAIISDINPKHHLSRESLTGLLAKDESKNNVV